LRPSGRGKFGATALKGGDALGCPFPGGEPLTFIHMFLADIFALKGLYIPAQGKPGASPVPPWVKEHPLAIALKGCDMIASISLCAALSGLGDVLFLSPGRCPGLVCQAPPGQKTKISTAKLCV